MRKYGFSLEKENRRLPPTSKWLDPSYEGEISEFDFELGKNINFPKNWQTDFPTYDYKISELKKIDYASNNSMQEELIKKFNIEHINELWIDFYEIFNDVLNPILAKSSKRRNRTKAYRSFHVNPDAAYALNHLVKTKHQGLFWEWIVTGKRTLGIAPYVESELYKRYPKCWTFGAECDGNTESVDNIRSIANTVDNVQLFTAQLSLGTVLCMSQILSHEGIAVFSMDQIDTFKFCLIYILACGFETINIAQTNSNSGCLYFVCENFKGISKSHINQMEKILKFTKNLEVRPAIFPKNKIAPEFIVKFCDAFTKVTIKREKKDIDWWIATTNICIIRDHLKLIN